MKKKIKKTKNNLIKVTIATIISVIIIGYICYTIFLLIKHPTDTFVIEEGKLYLEETTVGYIIREEKIIQGENYKNGIVKIKSEGERIAKNDAIFRYQSNREDELIQKISDLDVQIQDALQNETHIFPSDITLLENQIKSKLDDIYRQNDISKINKDKTEINSYITKKAKIAGDRSPAGSYIKKLITKRSEYENELNSNSEYLNATESGVVSYCIDGLENILTTDNLSTVNKELLNTINMKTGQLIGSSEEAAKIVNNFECYIAVIMNSEKAMQAEIGDKLKLQLPNTIEEIPAEIASISTESDESRVIIFKITKGVESLIQYRKISVDVIWWSSSGLKVPNTSILYENELTYVVRNRAGYLDKILVKPLKQNEYYTIITNYESDELKEIGYTTSEIRNLKKITMYDEIMLNPKT